MCRKVLTIPDEGLDALPHNFFLQNLLDAREASKEPPGDVLCEACEKDCEETGRNVSPAAIYCVDCNQKLCMPCSIPHRAMRGGPHRVKELQGELNTELIQQRGSYCDKHEGKRLELYCFDCKVNVCMKCFAVEYTRHERLEVEKAAERFVKSSETDVKRVASRISEFSASLIDTEAEKCKLMSATKDAMTLLKQRGEAVKCAVERQVDYLLREVQTFTTVTQKVLASRNEELQLGLTAMESFTAYSQELMSKGSPCDITRIAND